MKFKLIERTQKEIDEIREEDQFWAKRVKGTADRDICPLVVEMGNGKRVDVWDLTEQDIINLVKANVQEMTANGPTDKIGNENSFKVLKCWKEKNKTVSVDFVSMFYKLRDSQKGAKREVVRDMMNPLVYGVVAKATEIAIFTKGLNNDFSPVTDSQIVQVLKEQERQNEARKNLNNNQTA